MIIMRYNNPSEFNFYSCQYNEHYNLVIIDRVNYRVARYSARAAT